MTCYNTVKIISVFSMPSIYDALNEDQKDFIKLIKTKSYIFGLGAAGAGKTFAACLAAADILSGEHESYNMSKIGRVVIIRPVTVSGGGKSIGLLPGTMHEKYINHCAPVVEELKEVVSINPSKYRILQKGLTQGFYSPTCNSSVEIAPPEFIRGRTFKDCVVLLDDAQNFSVTELKMILTRLGENAKMLFLGDPAQIDTGIFYSHGSCPLDEILVMSAKAYKHIGKVRFSSSNIMRSEAVRDVVKAWENYDKKILNIKRSKEDSNEIEK